MDEERMNKMNISPAALFLGSPVLMILFSMCWMLFVNITPSNCYDCTFGHFEWCSDEDGVGACNRGRLLENCTSTCEEEETPCLLGVYFWSANLCDHITFFVVQVIGALFLYFGTWYVLYRSFYDRRSPSSSPSEPLDSSNSQFCPLCGCLWRNPPSFCSGFLRFVTPLPNPLLLKRSAEEEELSEIKTNEISFDTTPPAVEIMFCPFHDFRDPLQFYGSYTLVVTSLWFFTWQSGNPLADFRLFLFLYSILIYLPFLYFWFQCSRKVEYETESTSDEDIHLSHNARRERTARFILKLSHLAEEEILAVGQLLPLPAKKETGMYISQLLKGQFGVLSFVCLFFFWIFIPLQLGGLVWLMPVFGLLPWTYFTLSLFCESEKRFIIPIACSSSQCLIFIHILFDSIEVVSMSQVELSDKLFLVGFPSPDKVQLRPCTKIGDWELASGGGGGVGVLNWKKNEYKKKVQPSIHLFPSVPLITSTFYVQFQDDEIVKKFRDSWFGFSPECKNLPQKGSTWFGLGFGSITLLIFFGLVLFNWLGSFPSIPLLIFFFFGILGTWIIFILERFGDDDLPVWTHLASPCEVV